MRGWALGAVVWCCACSSYRDINIEDARTVRASTAAMGASFCAYAPVALRATVTYKDGEVVKSRAPGERAKGKLRTSEFAWTSTVGAVDAQAVLQLPKDPLAWYDTPLSVTVAVHKNLAMTHQLTLEPKFDCGGTFDIRGARGARGGEAENGGPGGSGPVVNVALAYLQPKTRGRLVLVRVTRESLPADYFLVSADSPKRKLVIHAGGGQGGRGGQGVAGLGGDDGLDGRPGEDGVECGDGGPGESGTDGTPGGEGGPGANGGDGGAGGTVTVRYDARHPELANVITVIVEGGDPGSFGPGGEAGRGGRAGQAGAGGKAGVVADETGAVACEGNPGPAGVQGTVGASGSPGADGVRGQSGPPGTRTDVAVPVSQLFAAEIERGFPITVEGGR